MIDDYPSVEKCCHQNIRRGPRGQGSCRRKTPPREEPQSASREPRFGNNQPRRRGKEAALHACAERSLHVTPRSLLPVARQSTWCAALVKGDIDQVERCWLSLFGWFSRVEGVRRRAPPFLEPQPGDVALAGTPWAEPTTWRTHLFLSQNFSKSKLTCSFQT